MSEDKGSKFSSSHLVALAQARSRREAIRDRVCEMRAKWDEEVRRLQDECNRKCAELLAQAKDDPKVIEQMVELSKANDDVTMLEAVALAHARECYETSQDKHPADGVSVRINRDLVYNPDVAMLWARAEMPTAIETRLKVREFEKYARAVMDTSKRLEFVTVEERVTITIADDLSAYLGGGENG